MPALYGDANLDGVVDGYDLGILVGDYTHTGMTWSLGDCNYDGTVDGYDLGMIIGNYTKPGPVVLNVSGLNLDAAELSALRAAGITPVPEPSSVIMLLVAAVVGGFWGRQRGQAPFVQRPTLRVGARLRAAPRQTEPVPFDRKTCRTLTGTGR